MYRTCARSSSFGSTGSSTAWKIIPPRYNFPEQQPGIIPRTQVRARAFSQTIMPSPGFVRSCRNTKKRDHGRPVVTMLEAGKAKGECHFYGCPLLSQHVYYDPLVKEQLTQLRPLKQDEASDE